MYIWMNAEYVNVVAGAVVTIGSMLFGESLTMGEAFLNNKTSPLEEVAVLIGITGQVKGQVIFSFTEETAKHMASALMGGMSIPELDDISKSAVAEVGNMIMGTASTALSQKGIITDISPPNLIVGKNMLITGISKGIVVPMKGNMGLINIELFVEEK